MQGYWCYWHGGKGYSGVGLHISQAIAPDRPLFSHPAFDYENRIVTTEVSGVTVASVYVPNGGKDFPAKMRFLEAMDDYARAFQDAAKPLIVCGDLNVARTDRDVHPKERKPRAIGQLPEERQLIERIIGRALVDVGRAVDPDNVVGAVAQYAPAQHRLAARLRPRQLDAGIDGRLVPRSEGRRYQRSRAGGCYIRVIWNVEFGIWNERHDY